MAPKSQAGLGVKRARKNTTASEVVEGIDLTGKTFFITGGNSGKGSIISRTAWPIQVIFDYVIQLIELYKIHVDQLAVCCISGFETARALALRNAHVVIGSRSIARGMVARGDILEEKCDAKIDALQLDNSDLQSVKECAEKYIAKGWPLHCLILNASVYDPLHRITDDEFEATFQVNHLAHFLLTQLLTPVLIKSAPSRVIVVSSESHRGVGAMALGPDDITWERLSPTHTHKMNSALIAYDLSKLCNILFANALHQRLSPYDVTVNSVNPGIVRSDLQGSKSKLLRSFLVVAKPWVKNAEQGAASVVYCATSPDLTPENGGRYFDQFRAKSPSIVAQNHENAERLWELSELMIDTHEEKRQRTVAKIDLPIFPQSHKVSVISDLQTISEDAEKEASFER